MATSVDTPLISLMREEEFPTLSEMLEDQSTPGPAEQLEMQEILSILRDAIDRLPERERLLLAMYYHEELTMKEISKVMGVSESRVCQLHIQAIVRLRSAFSGHRQEDARNGTDAGNTGHAGHAGHVIDARGSLAHGRWHRRVNPSRM